MTKAAAGSLFVLCALAGCSRKQGDAADQSEPHAAELKQLRVEEDELLRTRGGRATPWTEKRGTEPFRLVRWGSTLLGLSRSGTLSQLDDAAETSAEFAVPAGASGWSMLGDELWVVSSETAVAAAFRRVDGRIEADRTLPLHAVAGLREIVLLDQDTAIATDSAGHQLVVVDLRGGMTRPVSTCRGAQNLVMAGDFVVANCLLDHELLIFRRGDEDWKDPTRIRHDGPFWSVAARVSESDALLLAAFGVENHPLDRSEGFFGNVDSFAYAYTVGADASVEAGPTLNLSEYGVVTPKWASFEADGSLLVTGYGSDRMARVSDLFGTPSVQTYEVPAGLTELVGTPQAGIAANPLLDAWVVFEDGAWEAVRAGEADQRSPSERLGEALAFTTLMGPSNVSEGSKSRFTCETCHFEGRVDGRVHFTGRGEIFATTKTLRGLGGNRPHFSRALDRSSTQMVNNEFKVVSKGTAQDPWFSLDLDKSPWVRFLWGEKDPSATELRQALLVFLTSFDPAPNPHLGSRTEWRGAEAEGARLFADHCEGCHSARLVVDDPSSALERNAWEEEIFGAGSIKWASAERFKTGIEPYVHEEGARPPSLRRLWVKYPYFTNGSARSIDAVLRDVRLGTDFSHAAGEGQPLGESERAALVAFLRIL